MAISLFMFCRWRVECFFFSRAVDNQYKVTSQNKNVFFPAVKANNIALDETENGKH